MQQRYPVMQDMYPQSSIKQFVTWRGFLTGEQVKRAQIYLYREKSNSNRPDQTSIMPIIF